MRNALICLVFTLGTLTIAAAGELTHEVRQGETLYSIARAYEIGVDDLVAFNEIESPELLLPGTVLSIPGQYRVRKGDTLFSISRRYGIPVNELSRLNDLDGSTIVVGQRLRVPFEGGTPEPRIATRQALDGDPIDELSGDDDDSDASVNSDSTGEGSGGDVLPVARPIPVAMSITEPLSYEDGGAWPVAGSRRNLEGKFPGVMIEAGRGTPVAAVSEGRIVYSGPHSSFGNVIFVQSPQGYVYVYGGQETVTVSVGDEISAGTMIGTVGVSPTEGSPALYFSVWRNNRFVDPEQAPRG